MEQTSPWVGRDPVVLKRISEATGINVIMTSTYYETPPQYIDSLSIDALADQLIREITEGVEETGIRAGIIGEILTCWPLASHEEKALRAAARAQKKTGAALSIHPSPWDQQAMPLLDIVESEGGDVSRVVICHLDHVMDVEYHKAVAARGVYVEYDRCGIERYGGSGKSIVGTDRVASHAHDV